MSDILESVARACIPNKHALYVALGRNQFVLPKEKDAIMTKDFMLGVPRGEYWCLQSHEIKQFRVCAEPPNKVPLAEIVYEIMMRTEVTLDMRRAFHRTAELISKHPPCVEW